MDENSKVLNVSIGSPVDATASNVVNDPILSKLSITVFYFHT